MAFRRQPFLRCLPDAELVARVRALVARERGATALLVAHLAELDTRDVHLREGHSSLFAYCRDALALSEHEAYNRIEAARAARRFPMILDLLEEGAVNLTTVRLLAPHLTARNHRRVLESARGKRKPEVEEIVARLGPRPDVPSSIRRLPAPLSSPLSGTAAARVPAPALPAAAAAAALPLAPDFSAAEAIAVLASPGAASPGAASPGAASPGAASPGAAPPRAAFPGTASASGAAATVTPLSVDRYKLQVTIDGEILGMLRRAKDLLRHAIPSGDEAAILGRALSTLLAELARLKPPTPRGLVPRGSRPRRPGGPATSRPPSGARSGNATSAAARSWERAAAAARSGPSWSSITCGRTARAGRVRSRTSSFGAAATTHTRPGPSAGPAGSLSGAGPRRWRRRADQGWTVDPRPLPMALEPSSHRSDAPRPG